MSTALDELFAPLERLGSFVVGQLGQSLDGRIATISGHSHYINGPEDIERLHRLRALVDAVVVGAGTVAADDPRLTVRKVEGANPVRVALDPRGDLDPERAMFTDGAAPTLWMKGATKADPSTRSSKADTDDEQQQGAEDCDDERAKHLTENEHRHRQRGRPPAFQDPFLAPHRDGVGQVGVGGRHRGESCESAGVELPRRPLPCRRCHG